jgi:aryl sulfotransferase
MSDFAFQEDELITWIASYPKSGSTWIRILIDAYRANGYVDINDLQTGHGDSSAAYTRSVSAIPLKNLTVLGEWLLRPAALLTAMSCLPAPRIFKTHYANVVADGMPAFIPRALTQRAIYIFRDPRSVITSLAEWYDIDHTEAVEVLGNENFNIKAQIDGLTTTQHINTWSRHVRSWMDEKRFPVLLVSYEDMLESAETELSRIVRFLGMDYDRERVRRAVKAAELSKLRRAEAKTGFREFLEQRPQKQFFGKGGTRWQNEVEPELIAKVEEDHREMMLKFNYLEEEDGLYIGRSI